MSGRTASEALFSHIGEAEHLSREFQFEAPETEFLGRFSNIVAFTYAAVARTDSKIVAGEWWPADYAGPPIISLDASLAKGFGIGLGDTLTLNILGREITATVASLREIDWRSLRFDFAIIFAPGTLEARRREVKSATERSEAAVCPLHMQGPAMGAVLAPLTNTG